MDDIRRYESQLTELELSIYAAIAYRDVFEFPLTDKEIHRFLPYVSATLDQVRGALSTGSLVPSLVVTNGEYFALEGRERIFSVRRGREKRLDVLWKRARKFARIVANLPFVETIAISGSLAAGNPNEGADIDLFVIISKGHLWRTRILIRALRHLDFAFGTRTFCPNSMRTTASLRFEFERIYIAQELMQLEPVYGETGYLELLAANLWSQKFLPNAEPQKHVSQPCQPYSGTVRRLLTMILDSPFGEWFEQWSSARKIESFSQPEHVLSSYTPFTKEQEGLNIEFANRVEGRYFTLLDTLGIVEQSGNLTHASLQVGAKPSN